MKKFTTYWTDLRRFLPFNFLDTMSVEAKDAGKGKVALARQFAGFFSIATVHLLFYVLKIDFALWSVIDFGLASSIVFSFGLVLGLSFLALRTFGLFSRVFWGLIIFGYLGFVSIYRRFFKQRRGLIGQKTAAENLLNDISRMKLFFRILATGFILPILILPLPSFAAVRLGVAKTSRALKKYALVRDAVSWFIGIGVFCYFYSGFDIVLIAVVLTYICALLAYFILVVEHRIPERVVGKMVLSVRSPQQAVRAFSGLEDRARGTLVALLILLVSLISAFAGAERYQYLVENSIVLVSLASGEQELLSQIGSTSQGFLFWSRDTQQQYFYPFSAIERIETVVPTDKP